MRLLQVEGFKPGDPDVRFEFAHALPAWGWAIVVTSLAGLAAWSYWRIAGPTAGRTALAIVRTLTLVLIALLVAGPQLVKQPERVERDWVVVMLDRSKSLSIADVGGEGGSARITREEQLRRAITSAGPAMEKLAKERNVLWLGFDTGAYPLATGTNGLPSELPAPDGVRTSVGRSLEQAMQMVAARPVSGVILVSDGRSTDEPSRALRRRLEAEQIPVFVAPLGSASPVIDLSIARVEAPSSAFVDDVVPVNIEIAASGGEVAAARGIVELVDSATGLVLDRKRLDDAEREPGRPARLTLATRPEAPGRGTWAVRLLPDSPDLTSDNNAQALSVELVDRPIRVVYFDGYPRWEQRYLKNLLLREKSIRSSSLLLSADKQFIQEGTDPLASLPSSPGDWAGIDVVIIGDMRAELLSDEQMMQLREHVAQHGAGLLWIAGPGATPGSYRSRPLADLLPFKPDPALSGPGVAMWPVPVTPAPAPGARRLGLLNLGDRVGDAWPIELSDPMLGWTTLRWAQRIEPAQLKPTAEILAEARPNGEAAGARPLVTTMRYGAGRVVYVATDEIWRWRYGRGETLHERFYLPLLRFLARDSLSRTGKPALLTVDPERAESGQPTRILLRLLDQALVDSKATAQGISARITRVKASDSAPVSITLTRETPGSFGATFIPGEPGEYKVEIADSVLAGLGLAARIDVASSDDELRRPQADHGALASIAEATGGRELSPDRLDSAIEFLPNRQLRVLGTPEIVTLWDRLAILMAVISLLAIEWLGRKWIRLA